MSESKLTPNQTFYLGMGVTLLVGFGIGFFILLGEVLTDDGSKPNRANPTVITDTGGTGQGAGAGTGEIVLADVTDEDWIKGNIDARISIVEFSDTECPFCKRFHTTMNQVMEAYPDDVNWVYRHFPLPSLHRKAQKESEATECAGELAGNDGFWAYIDRLFEITPSNDGLDESQLPEIAEYIGLDKNDFEECLNSGRHGNKVRKQASDATLAGGQGTPYSVLIVDGEKFPVSGAVPFSQIQSMIDSVL
jgi:protein-disulfide isomerase